MKIYIPLCLFILGVCYVPMCKTQEESLAVDGGYSDVQITSQYFQNHVLKGLKRKLNLKQTKKFNIRSAQEQFFGTSSNYLINFDCLRRVKKLCKKGDSCSVEFNFADELIMNYRTPTCEAQTMEIVGGDDPIEPVVGGWSTMDLTSTNDIELLSEGLNALAPSLRQNHNLKTYWENNAITMDNAEYQVVAGYNFKVAFTCLSEFKNFCWERQKCTIDFYYVPWMNPGIGSEPVVTCSVTAT